MTVDSIVKPASSLATGRRPVWLVILLAWLVVVFDGYDLIVYGATLPAILAEPGWNLNPASGGTIGSLAFLGMMVGALAAGNLADRVGRRNTILISVACFTLFTGASGLVEGPIVFGALRFLAGVGLGGLVPSANALTAEFVTPRFRAAVSTIMMSGVPIGGSLASVLAIPVLPNLGWQAMYLFGFAGVALLALTWFLMPESPTWLRTKGRSEEAAAIEAQYGMTHVPAEKTTAPRPTLAAIFRSSYLLATILFALATVATLFAWYGLGTWLPKLMGSDPRFNLGNPLTFLLALNLGAVAGSVLTAYAATRVGPIKSAIGSAAAAAIGLAFLLTYPSSAVAVYAALILAGVGTHGTQCLIIAAVASHYPATLRGTALGFALGAGRIGAVAAPQVAGVLLAANLGVGSNFLLFAGAAGLAAIVLFLTHLFTRPTSVAADLR